MTPHQKRQTVIIVLHICSRYNVSPGNLESPTRTWALVWPRWICIAMLRHFVGLTEYELGRLFCRATSSISRALIGFEAEVSSYPYRDQEVAEIRRALETLGMTACPPPLSSPAHKAGIQKPQALAA